VDESANGQWFKPDGGLFPECHRKLLDKMAKPGASFDGSLKQLNSATLRSRKSGQPSQRNDP
jgi:hypothetical protein